MAGRKREEPQEVESTWMASYGDMITNLLIFFVLLYSMSIVDMKKFTEAQTSLQESLDGKSGSKNDQDTQTEREMTAEEVAQLDQAEKERLQAAAAQKQLEELKQELEKVIKEQGLEGLIELELTPDGLKVFVSTAPVLFALGSADLSPEALEFLGRVAQVLQGQKNFIDVHGHTDDIPIQSGFKYPSNWELSAARASVVVRFMIEGAGMDPRLFSAAGYADTKPRVPNDSDENRQSNRRVEIIILELEDPAIMKEEAPQEEAPQEEAPQEEAPQEEAPQEEAPQEEAPQEEAPQEDTGGSEQPLP